jgi:hypothetical protein
MPGAREHADGRDGRAKRQRSRRYPPMFHPASW